jgi:protocatechuate 3,4-dioxygenase, beta subunit
MTHRITTYYPIVFMLAMCLILPAAYAEDDYGDAFSPGFDEFGYETDESINGFSPAGDRYAKFCTPTPSLQSYAYPGAEYVHSGNSLARPAGKSQYADGELLYLTGRVFDSACVPLRDATVEIWHTDANGEYRIADSADMINPYPLFAGAGHIKTNNEGEFQFETIMPGVAKITQPPIINIRVFHPSMRLPLTTTIYFKGESRNENSLRYKNLSMKSKELVSAVVIPIESEDINAGFRAHFDVTVAARDGFRGF